MKAVILARVSTKEQEDGHSLDAQLKLLHSYCERNNLNIIKEFRVVESSTKGDRKEFKEMLSYINAQKEPIALVCHKVDRLQRSFNDYPLLNIPLQEGMLELHFTNDNSILTKDSNSSQKLMWNMNIVMAQSYTDSISDNVKRSQKKKLEEGTITGSAPLGYLNVTRDDGKKDVILDPQRAHLVRGVFEDYSTGLYSLKSIASMASDYGLTSKKGKKLTKNTIYYLISNPFYYGCMENKGKLYPHVYQTLISKELWNKCQDIRNGKKVDYSKSTKTDFIFKGLIKCKKCGCSISPEIKKGKYVYLRPNTKPGCDCKQITEKQALEQVKMVLQSISMPEELLEAFKVSLKQSVESKREFSMQSIKGLELKAHDIQKKIDKLLNLFLDDSITLEVYNKKDRELRSELNNIGERVKQFNNADEQYAITVQYLISLASRAYDLFESSGNDKKRRILNIVFSNLYLNGKTLEFSMRKPFDKLVSLPKGLNWLR